MGILGKVAGGILVSGFVAGSAISHLLKKEKIDKAEEEEELEEESEEESEEEIDGDSFPSDLTCKYCGANLKTDPYDYKVICPYCDCETIYNYSAYKKIYKENQKIIQAELEAEEKIELNEAEIDKEKTKSKAAIILISSLFIFFISIVLLCSDNDNTEKNKINIPFSSELIIQEALDYKFLDNRLSSAGFENIILEEVNDLDFSNSEYIGTVKEVEIYGKTTFDENEQFSPNEKIIIRYHTLSKNAFETQQDSWGINEQTEEIITNSIDESTTKYYLPTIKGTSLKNAVSKTNKYGCILNDILSGDFGEKYASYKATVRKWKHGDYNLDIGYNKKTDEVLYGDIYSYENDAKTFIIDATDGLFQNADSHDEIINWLSNNLGENTKTKIDNIWLCVNMSGKNYFFSFQIEEIGSFNVAFDE